MSFKDWNVLAGSEISLLVFDYDGRKSLQSSYAEKVENDRVANIRNERTGNYS